MQMKDPDFFEKFGLELTLGNVEEGKTYWIYGWITKFLDEEPGNVLVELNFSIHAQMSVPDSDKVELLKERAFEPGIFVCTVLSKNEQIVVDCHTVVFGKRQSVMI